MTTTNEPRRQAGLAEYRPQPVALATPAGAIDMFVAGTVLARAVYVVVGEGGIACVPSQSSAGAAAYLFWSHQTEAEKWADALVTNPRIVAIDLNGFLSETLPAMSAAGAVAALDWTAEPIEAEMHPLALSVRLTEELTRDFAAKATLKREVWMIDDGDGIASLTGRGGAKLVPLWADRHMADEVLASCDPGRTIVRVPLQHLNNRYLLSSEGLKALLAPAYVHISTPITMSPWALKALLNGAGRAPSARIAQMR